MSEHVQSEGAPGPERAEELDLCEQDRVALESLLEDWRFSGAANGVGPDRRAKVAAVLALLDSGADGGWISNETLIDVTLARVARLRGRAGRAAAEGEPVLVPDDDDALESLVSAGFDARRAPSAVRSRAERQAALLGLIGWVPEAGASEDLIDRTLARVQRSIDSQEERLLVQGRGGWSIGRLRMSDLVSAAAMLLVATALFAPVFGAMRERSRQNACASNMAVAGVGFGLYGNDNKNMMPLATASLAGNPWWNTGKQVDQSNSANLYVLNRANYTSLAQLSCPGNARARCVATPDSRDWGCIDEVSFSMQNMYARERPNWNTGSRVVVLADASPVVRRAVRHELIYPFENSFNHGGKGQGVLWNDGSCEWLSSPVLENNDNIWLPRFVERAIANVQQGRPPGAADPLNGTESPVSATDVFVGP
jgi:hypothetical protein